MTCTIVCDSTAYLPSDTIKRLGIIVIPLNVHINGKIYKEGLDISNQDYFALLKRSKIFPTTSQPSSGEFLDLFNRLHTDEEMIVILISAALSGSVQSAMMARQMLPHEHQARISIIDSRFSAAGLAFQAVKAAEMAGSGYSRGEICTELQQMQSRQGIFFVVKDLEYLVRGGRLNKTAGLVGTLMQIKPVLYVNDGKVELYEKVRTWSRAMDLIIRELEKRRGHLERLAAIHVAAPEEGKNLQTFLEREFKMPVMLNDIGPVVGSHTGPGTVGIAYC